MLKWKELTLVNDNSPSTLYSLPYTKKKAMKKRTFLKTSSVLATGSLLSPLVSCGTGPEKIADPMVRTNWAGNLTYSAEIFHEPADIETIQAIVRSSDKLRVLGTRHCFNDIADSPAMQVSVRALDQVGALNEADQTVTIGAGMSYGQLCPWLQERGYALHNLASLPHISVAGACATATHGSGMKNGNLPSAAIGIEFIDAAGNIQTLSREKDGAKFAGAIIHLGGLGVLTKLTLQIEPTYEMYQYVYQDLPVSELLDNFQEIMSAAYSVSLFTDWQTDKVNQVWFKCRVGEALEGIGEPEIYGATLFDRKVHPILDHSAESCTEQMGRRAPWYDIQPHFKMEFTPSSGKELQSEFFVPLRNAMGAFEAIDDLSDQVGPLLMISEVRAIAADDFWMSPCYGQDCIAFHFTWKQEPEKLQQLLPVLEGTLADFEARPHWGKVFTMSKERLEVLYPKLPEYRALLREYDPEGKFVNGYMREHLF